MATGRPTKLNDEIISRANKYLEDNEAFGPAALLPTIERLSLVLEVNRDTLYEWASNNREFSDIISRLKAMQADKLIQNGLAGRWNSVISKLMLSKHGYVEKQETDLTSAGDKIEPVVIYRPEKLPDGASNE